MTKSVWIWKVGRVVLAIVLLAAVFKYFIKISDSVRLKDGTEVTGTVTRLFETGKNGKVIESADNKVVIEVSGKPLEYGIDEVAVKAGKPQVEQGLVSLLKMTEPTPFVIAMVLLGVAPVVASARWQWLLAAQGIHISFWRALELTLIGLFFNNFMPGLTGGDVVKAYYAAKLTGDKKTHAVVTVFLDRVIGMVALGIVAGAAIVLGFFVAGAGGGLEFREAAWFVAVFIVVAVAGGLCFYSRRLRRFLGTATKAMPGYKRFRETKLVDRAAGMMKRIDGALYLYKYKKMVLVNTTSVSLIAHTSAILSIYFFGQALGIRQAGLLTYFVVVPVCFIISSVPVTPAGWGVGEAIFKVMFGAVGVPGTAAVTMSVIYRLTSGLWTLPGGVLLMLQRDKTSVAELESEMAEAEGEEKGDGGQAG